jgi:hypothetical protein
MKPPTLPPQVTHQPATLLFFPGFHPMIIFLYLTTCLQPTHTTSLSSSSVLCPPHTLRMYPLYFPMWARHSWECNLLTIQLSSIRSLCPLESVITNWRVRFLPASCWFLPWLTLQTWCRRYVALICHLTTRCYIPEDLRSLLFLFIITNRYDESSARKYAHLCSSIATLLPYRHSRSTACIPQFPCKPLTRLFIFYIF